MNVVLVNEVTDSLDTRINCLDRRKTSTEKV
jgi:hypothetical protein